MPEPLETNSNPVADLWGEEFRRGRSYLNRRSRGSGNWLLIYTEDGAGSFRTPAGELTARAGVAVLYAPEDYQDYRTDPETGHWTLRWAHFMPKAHWMPWLQWPGNPGGLRFVRLEDQRVRQGFSAAMGRTIRLLHEQIPLGIDLAANALEEALLWARIAATGDRWLSLDERVQRAIDYLAAHLQEDIRLETLARHCGLSVSRLAHVFKNQTALSPQQFLESNRMQRAGQLLRLTALSVAEVAAETGYQDAFYFSKRFRRWSGQSPTVYRSQRQHPPADAPEDSPGKGSGAPRRHSPSRHRPG